MLDNSISSRDQRRVAVVHQFLQSQSTLVLSTIAPDGKIHSAPLYYLATENLDLYWISSRRSAHSQHIATNPSASAAIFQSTFNWREIAGVQMQGICSIAERHERAQHLKRYLERFQLNSLASFGIARATMYLFRPQWLRFTDNRKRFAQRFELDLSTFAREAPPTAAAVVAASRSDRLP